MKQVIFLLGIAQSVTQEIIKTFIVSKKTKKWPIIMDFGGYIMHNGAENPSKIIANRNLLF